MTKQKSGPDETSASPRRRRVRRGLVWAALGLLALAGLAALALRSVPGSEFALPGWARARIEARLVTLIPERRITVGGMTLSVAQNWRPSFFFERVSLQDLSGHEVARLGTLRVDASREAALRGEVQPVRVMASGLYMGAVRRADGTLGLSLAPDLGGAEFTGVADLAARIDAALEAPGLRDLERVEIAGVTLRFDDERAHRSWTVDGGSVRLIQTSDGLDAAGEFSLLTGGAEAAQIELGGSYRAGAALGFQLRFADMDARDIATQSPALVWLSALRGRISGALRGEVSPEGRLGQVDASLRLGPGAIQPTEATEPVRYAGASAYLTYTPARQRLRFSEITIETDWGSARAEGSARLIGMDQGWPTGLVAQIALSELEGNPGKLYDEARRIEAAWADLRLGFDPFTIEVGQAVAETGDGPLRATARVTGRADGWDVALDAKADRLSRAVLLRYWPQVLEPRTRDWVAQNVGAGHLVRPYLTLRKAPGERRLDLHLTSGFSGVRVRPVRFLPELSGGVGQMSILRGRFVVEAEAAVLRAPLGGEISLAGTRFIIPNIREKGGAAVAELVAEGAIPAALSLLDMPPLSLLSKAGRTPTLATGRARAEARLTFPRKPKLAPGELRFDVTARLRDVVSESLVPGRHLGAEALDLGATNAALRLSGTAEIDGLPLTGQWEQPLGQRGAPSRLEATAPLSAETLAQFGVALPEGMVTGVTEAAVVVDVIPNAPAKLDLRSDLVGAALRIPALSWSKARGTRGDLRFAARLGTPLQVETLTLAASGLEAQARPDLTDGKVTALVLERLKVGRWFEGSARLDGLAAGRAPKVAVTGGRLDLRAAPTGGAGGGAGGAMSVALDRLQITDSLALTGVAAEIPGTAPLSGRFSGRLNGAAQIAGRLLPQGARTGVEITSRDAGAVLRAAGLFKKVTGGTLALTLLPTGAPGTFEGEAQVRQIRLRDAPAMAALLDAISVIGLLQQLDQKGLAFNEVYARFRLAPDRVTLYRSSAVGPSLGMSMDGYFLPRNGQMDLQGVISPVYMLNGIASFLTRRGEGLIGFNFNLRGTPERPRVAVNPLSALTPGFLREIFRRPPPQLGRTHKGEGR